MNKNKLLSLDQIYNLNIDSIKKFYSEYINTNQSKILSRFSYGSDIFEKSEGLYLYTKENKKILDFSGGIGVLNHGHNNQKILNSRIDFQYKQRMEVHKTVFSPYAAGLAHNIASLLPKNLCKSFFCNSGAESVEGAIKASYKYHKSNRKYIAHSNISFHGKTIGSGSVSGLFDQDKFPKINNTLSFFYNDIESLKNIVEKYKNTKGESDIYAIIVETFNNSLLKECSDEFIKYLREVTYKYQIILIFDEVYTGWGKTGYLFHFYKYKNIYPDILCMSKSLGGGKSSISAYVVNRMIYKKIYENNVDAFLHTSTYNGFGEECITAIVSINELIKNKLTEKSLENGYYISKKLNDLKSKYPKYIKEVKGIGCIQGIVFNISIFDLAIKLFNKIPYIENQISLINKLPAASLSDYLYKKSNIFTVIADNQYESILYVSPSLIVETQQIDYFFESLEKSLKFGLEKILFQFIKKNLI